MLECNSHLIKLLEPVNLLLCGITSYDDISFPCFQLIFWPFSTLRFQSSLSRGEDSICTTILGLLTLLKHPEKQSEICKPTNIFNYRVWWLACDEAARLILHLHHCKQVKREGKRNTDINIQPSHNVQSYKTLFCNNYSHKWLVHMISW